MKIHHTKNKGDLGVLKAQADLCSQGFLVCLPLTEHAPFDLIVYKNGRFNRIQVKYRSQSKRGTLDVSFKSYWSNKSGTKVSKQNLSEFDVCCVYCPDTDKCYYFDITKLSGVDFSLRIKESKKKYSDGRLNYAKDFEKLDI